MCEEREKLDITYIYSGVMFVILWKMGALLWVFWCLGGIRIFRRDGRMDGRMDGRFWNGIVRDLACIYVGNEDAQRSTTRDSTGIYA
jgi:hypothetical protein